MPYRLFHSGNRPEDGEFDMCIHIRNLNKSTVPAFFLQPLNHNMQAAYQDDHSLLSDIL